MNIKNGQKKNVLSYRLLFFILLCSSCFTIIGTAIQLYNDYQKDVAIIHEGIAHIQRGHLKSLSTSLWDFNMPQLKIGLEGALKLPGIQYLEISEIRKGVEMPVISLGVPLKEHIISISFPLVYPPIDMEIGTLLVVASTESAISRLKERVVLILATQTVKTFMVSFCILFIFHQLIMKHLIRITDYLKKFELDSANTPLEISRTSPDPTEPDLLDQLVLTINTMRKRLNQNLEKRRQAEEALQKSYTEMEKKVAERTKELTKTNQELQIEIIERRQIEEKLIYAKTQAEGANLAKSEFLANISHELRNPMHHILNYSKYGVDKTDKSSKKKTLHYFKQIRKSAERLMLLLNDLLDLSKMEAGRMEYSMAKNDIQKIIIDSIFEYNSMLEEKELNLTVDNRVVEKVNVYCDSYKIGQVMRNLLSNAIKFSPNGKYISIISKVVPSLFNGKKHPNIQITVMDQGVGIPENELITVFDKFSQSSITKTGAGGTGLGLAICWEIIRSHNGSIWAENNQEGGANFNFVLPCFLE